MISRVHARIEIGQAGTFLEDMNSTNGTHVNGELLQYRERRMLQKGDIISMAVQKHRCKQPVPFAPIQQRFRVHAAIPGDISAAACIAAIRNKGKFQGLTLKGLVLMTALCMYYGITSAGVDNWAHAGGAAGGFFLCVLLYRKTHNA